jgi:hypothetical protein
LGGGIPPKNAIKSIGNSKDRWTEKREIEKESKTFWNWSLKDQ